MAKMRKLNLSFLALGLAACMASSVFVSQGCKSEHAKPDWMKPPQSYQPVTNAKLTFNQKGLERFNFMEPAEKEAFVEQLKKTPGSYIGQAIVQAGTGVSNLVPEYKFGTWEITAATDPVLYEIPISYQLYTTPELGRSIARNRAVEFSGTVIGVDFQDQDKPRSIMVRVKINSIKALE